LCSTYLVSTAPRWQLTGSPPSGPASGWGLTLGGGIGLLGRTHGLTCDRLVGAQVVLADGTVVECSEGEK
jgi:FAD/FMN-containing dehydrogenase